MTLIMERYYPGKHVDDENSKFRRYPKGMCEQWREPNSLKSQTRGKRKIVVGSQKKKSKVPHDGQFKRAAKETMKI